MCTVVIKLSAVLTFGLIPVHGSFQKPTNGDVLSIPSRHGLTAFNLHCPKKIVMLMMDPPCRPDIK